MTIRSVDMQVLVQKMGDVTRVQQAQQSDHQNRQQEFIQNINVQNERIAHSVDKPLRNESKLVHEKEEQEKGSKSKSQKRGKEEEEENKKKGEAQKGSDHLLDIII
ncbi:hypothetical protein [Syntrophomonas palmitatica]|uniref:hypothetical protein n=1 Tax=Syntrophomonas palmitatica TaxID=402877 RepID=UPI0006D2115F|nr:hypothetical protein [Syntrophomonas palmitatica]